MLSENEFNAVRDFIRRVIAEYNKCRYLPLALAQPIKEDEALLWSVAQDPSCTCLHPYLAKSAPNPQFLRCLAEFYTDEEQSGKLGDRKNSEIMEMYEIIISSPHLTADIAELFVDRVVLKRPINVSAALRVIKMLIENPSLPASFIEETIVGRCWGQVVEADISYRSYYREFYTLIPLILARVNSSPGAIESLFESSYDYFSKMPLRVKQLKEVLRDFICPATPPSVLARIADLERRARSAYPGHGFNLIRKCLAQHPALPVRYLTNYATDSNEDVRLEALANPSMPAEVLVRAYKSALRSGRRALLWSIASNPSCPQDILLQLVLSGDAGISARAKETMRKLQSPAT